MSTLLRSDFIARMTGLKVALSDLTDPSLQALRLSACDVDRDGVLSSRTELDRLFTELDRLDNNGNRDSVRLGDPGAPTAVSLALDAVEQAAEPTGALRDVALANAFGTTARFPIQNGNRGPQVVALQYALGRLGWLLSTIDGSFGNITKAAVQAFQNSAGLPATGLVDRATLEAIDQRVSQTDLRVPAARFAEPFDYLSDFSRFSLSTVTVSDLTRPLDFSHPEIREAYGRFCAEYWPVMKENRIECDCKTISLFLLRQFRAKAKQDLGVELPMPSRNGTRLANTSWTSSTGERTGGYFSRFSTLPVIRPGYSGAIEIQKVDPTHSMLYGINIRQNGLNADAVSRVVDRVIPGTNNRGNTTKPEIDVNALHLGDTIFMDHKGDGRFDHAMTVVGLERDGQGRVTNLTLAIGSFDDMKDANSDTPPRGPAEINQYAEELQISFDSAGGILGSGTTWTSEPAYIAKPRYTPQNTLMELRAGGTIFVGRWNNT